MRAVRSYIRWEFLATSERHRNAGCRGCRYVDEHYHCNYYLILGPGHRRNAPMYEGGGCAKYDAGSRPRKTWDSWLLTDRQKRKAQKAGQATGPLDTARAMELYGTGASDAQIANKLGTTKSKVYRWRQKAGLPSNHKPERKEGTKR